MVGVLLLGVLCVLVVGLVLVGAIAGLVAWSRVRELSSQLIRQDEQLRDARRAITQLQQLARVSAVPAVGSVGLAGAEASPAAARASPGAPRTAVTAAAATTASEVVVTPPAPASVAPSGTAMPAVTAVAASASAAVPTSPTEPPVSSATPAAPRAPSAPQPIVTSAAVGSTDPAVEPVARWTAPAAASTAAPVADATISAMEGLLGKRLMTWFGVGILFLGMAFFLKYAYDQQWLGQVFGPRMRILSVVGLACALMWGGAHVLRQGMSALGQGLLGGGVAALYLAVFGAFSPVLMIVPHELLSPDVAFALMALVTAWGVFLALRHDAIAISVIAVLGGFATPVLIGSGGNARDVLFTYLLVLDLGVLVVAMYRRWRVLDGLTLIGTVALFAGWYASWYGWYPSRPNYGTLAWVGVFHLVFLALPFIHHWRTRAPITVARFALALGNLAWSLGYAAAILDGQGWLMAVICLLLSGGYLAIGVMTARRIGADQRADHGFTALSTMLLTLGLFYLLPVDGVSLAWCVEASVLLYLGYLFSYAPTRWASLVVLGLALARLALHHLPDPLPEDPLFWNHRFAMQLLGPLALASFAGVHGWQRAQGRDRLVLLGSVLLAGVLLLLLSSLEILRHADAHPGAWRTIPAATAIGWCWGLGALGYLVAARRWRLRALLLGALAMLALTVVAVLLSYLQAWTWTAPVLNPRFLTALGVCGLSALAARWARSWPGLSEAWRLDAVLTVLVQLLALLVATCECAGWMQRHGSPASTLDLQWVLTLVWLGVAGGSALVGLAWRSQLLLWMSALPLVAGAGSAGSLYLQEWGSCPLFINGRFIAGILALGVTALVAWVALRLRQAAPAWHTATGIVLAVLALLLMDAETVSFCQASITPDTEAGRWSCWCVSATWLAGTIGGLILWRRWAQTAWWYFALACSQLAAFTTLLLLVTGWDARLMFVNLRCLLLITLLASLHGLRGEIRTVRLTLARAMAIEIMAALFLGLSCEGASWFLNHIQDPQLGERLATFSITVMWTLLASAWLTIGFRRRVRMLRLSALGLYAATAVKLLVIDMAQSQQLYRILAFFGVGLVFVAAAYAYHVMERRLARPPAATA